MGKHDISRLQIAVQDASVVGAFYSGADLHKDLQHPVEIHRPFRGQYFGQILTLQIFHGVIGKTIFMQAQVGYTHKIDVLQLGDYFGLLLEALPADIGNFAGWYHF